MSYDARVLRVMIASPGDVAKERAAVREILHSWNDVNSEFRKIVLLPVGWETNTTPTMGRPAQEIINEQILAGSDILIGIFWTRLGTATSEYKSGTVEEIKEHVKSGKTAKLYFSQAPVIMDSVDHDQYKALTEFKAECRKSGLYEVFSDLDDFRDKFRRQLELELNKDEHGNQIKAAPTGQQPKNSLTNEATQLLCEAAKDPHGHIMHLRHLGGETIQTNSKGFIDNSSPRSASLWNGALAELEEQGLIERRGSKGEMFTLTRHGFEWVDKYIAEMPLAIEVKLDRDPPNQQITIRANKEVQVTRVDYSQTSGAAVSGQDVELSGQEIDVEVDNDLLIQLWNSPRPDRQYADHAGPAQIVLAIAHDGKRSQLTLPVLLEPFWKANTHYIRV